MILQHLPALQVLIPFISALLVVVMPTRFVCWLLTATTAIICLALSVWGMSMMGTGMNYEFGNWPAPIGIEYRLDYLNQPIIIFVNFVLVFFLTFGRGLVNATIMKYIDSRKQRYFYSVLLFAHTGYLGVLSTNDLFNLYVFIEISSLATYVLMSKGKNPFSIVGAFDYLILGTIGATMILISIGFFLALTGSLNITDVAILLQNHFGERIVITAIVFFLTGSVLKMAFFPMHFWMVRAYASSAPFILTYLASISSLLGIYMVTRFVFFTIEGAEVQQAISSVIRPLALATIVICTFLALKSDDFKNVVIYSTASQVGYIFLLMTIWTAKDVMFLLIILDGLNKIALFTIIAYIESKTDTMKFADFKHIAHSRLFKGLICLSLLFSASLPLSSMFLVKIQLYEVLIYHRLYLEFAVVLVGSVLALLYHFRLGSAIFFTPESNGVIQVPGRYYGLIAIVIVQIMTLIYINEILEVTRFTETIILAG